MCNWLTAASIIGTIIISFTRIGMTIPGPLPSFSPLALAIYKDIAHIWVGGMLWAWAVGASLRRYHHTGIDSPIAYEDYDMFKLCFIWLTVIELISFGLTRLS